MLVYRIAKTAERCRDLSGFGAYKYGGRWNSAGTYMLYTSENSSLAYLENLVHFEADNFPPNLFIATLELTVPKGAIYEVANKEYPKNWQQIGSAQIKVLGDRWMREHKYAAIKVRSAVNTLEYNYLINPLFAGYPTSLKIVDIQQLDVDARLVK